MSSILLYLGLLILGGLLSYKGLVHKELYHRLDIVQLICLFALLFTTFTVVGSVLFVMLFRRGWLWLRREKA